MFHTEGEENCQTTPQLRCNLQWFDSVFNDHSTTPIRALCLAALQVSWVAIENKARPHQNGLCHYGGNVQSASFFAQGLAQCTLLAYVWGSFCIFTGQLVQPAQPSLLEGTGMPTAQVASSFLALPAELVRC